MNNQKHSIPGLVSLFIPGLGQPIKGDVLKGILIWSVGGVLLFPLVDDHRPIHYPCVERVWCLQFKLGSTPLVFSLNMPRGCEFVLS